MSTVTRLYSCFTASNKPGDVVSLIVTLRHLNLKSTQNFFERYLPGVVN